jgi:DNA-binding response OmpR family regulator
MPTLTCSNDNAEPPPLPAPVLCAHCFKLIVGKSSIYIDHAKKRVWWQGSPIVLTAGEFRVLTALVAAAHRVMTYQELYDILRKRKDFACHDTQMNVRSCVKRIRHKFAAVDPTFYAIKNVVCIGYTWEPI